MWAKHYPFATTTVLDMPKLVHKLLAQGRLRTHNVAGDGDCAYHSFACAILDLVDTGHDIDVPLERLTVPAMRMIVKDNARDFCRRKLGNNESADEAARIIKQECYKNEHGGFEAINILAEHFGVRVDVYDEPGDHVQRIQRESTHLPLINLVRVDLSQPQLNMAPPDVYLPNPFITSTEIPAASPTSNQAPASAPAPKPVDPPTTPTQIPTGSPMIPTEIPTESPTTPTDISSGSHLCTIPP